MVESVSPVKKAPSIAIIRMGSDLDDQVVGERDNSDENGDCSPQTYATEEDRMAAFLEF